MKITQDNFEEGAYRADLAWAVFYTQREDADHDLAEIQKVDVVEHPDTDEFFQNRGSGDEKDYNPWFENDDEAFIMVCFLALDGDVDAFRALKEIGMTRTELAKFLGRWS